MVSRGWESAVDLLDRGRRTVLAFALGVRPLAWVLSRRELRIPVLGACGALVAAGLAVVAPVLLFVLGPVVLGVPHVASDVRYLLVRRAMPRLWRTAAWIGCASLLAMRVLEEAHVFSARFERIELLFASLWVLVAAALGALTASPGRSRSLRLAIGLPPLLLLAAAAARHPVGARLVFVHAHNLVGVAVWLALFRRRGGVALIPVAVVALLAALFLRFTLVAYDWTSRLHGEAAFRLHILTITDWLAPGLPVQLAIGLVYTYVFLQSVHYAVWLTWIPQEDTRGQGSLTFRMTLRSLVRDFGSLGLVVVVASSAVVLAGALVQVHRARALYLSLAMFHGYLELAMLAYFVMRGSAPAARQERGESREDAAAPAGAAA